MMNFMREGGFSMWLMRATAVAAMGFAASRPRAQRPGVLVAGCIATIIESIFGLALGMAVVSRTVPTLPDPPAALAMGLGELSNNGILGALLATVLGVAALASASLASKAE